MRITFPQIGHSSISSFVSTWAPSAAQFITISYSCRFSNDSIRFCSIFPPAATICLYKYGNKTIGSAVKWILDLNLNGQTMKAISNETEIRPFTYSFVSIFLFKRSSALLFELVHPNTKFSHMTSHTCVSVVNS